MQLIYDHAGQFWRDPKTSFGYCSDGEVIDMGGQTVEPTPPMIWVDFHKGWTDTSTSKIYMTDGTISIIVGPNSPRAQFPTKGMDKLPSMVELEKRLAGEQIPEDWDKQKLEALKQFNESKKLNQPKETAARYSDGKPPMHYMLFFPRVFELLARVFEGGEHKYDYGNWSKGGRPDKEYLDSTMRHLTKRFGKQVIFDKDSKTNHIGHAIWNLMVLFELNDHPIIESEEAFAEALAAMDEIKRKREANDKS